VGSVPKFTINYVRREWVSVEADAPDVDTAIQRANKKLNVCHKDVGINDGKCEVAGYHNNSLINKVPN
jgi:hypothetical protein